MNTALKRVMFVAFLAALGGYAVFHLQGPHGITALRSNRELIEKLESEKAALEKDVEKQGAFNKELETNRDLIELMIRQKTKRLKPGEMEIRPVPKKQ